MLSALHIENYILLDSLDVSFPEGLVIVSGSTGAGKSIILGALSLLSGAKADASLLRDKGINCILEAEFSLSGDLRSKVQAILDEEDIPLEDGNLLVRRVIMPSSRSRAFVNDCPVTLPLLQNLSSVLLDIHSQHQNLQLSSPAFRLTALDSYSLSIDPKASERLSETAASYHRVTSLRKDLDKCRDELALLHRESSYNASLLDTLQKAGLRDGEMAELEAELTTLDNAEEILNAVYGASQMLSPSEGSGVVSMTKDASRLLSRISSHFVQAGPLSERLDAVKYELEDIAAELESLSGDIDMSPERKQWIDDRLSLLYDLLRRHGLTTEAELIALRQSLEGESQHTEELEERIASLEAQLEAESVRYDRLCSELHELRQKAAKSLSVWLGEKLHFLEMEGAIIDIVLREAPASEKGRDEAMFLYAHNASTAPIDAAKKASGGELSRIMLCLKSALARYCKLPTMIFDEIDTGVSGSVADKMGQMICSMGGDMQIFAITHLPQVAAKGQAHYLVSKDAASTSEAPLSTMQRIEDDARVMEIARMLSGSTITPEAISNAKALLAIK